MLITSIPQYIQGITNAKIDLTDTDNEVLYTAPSSADFNASVINSILVSNDSGSADTITVTLVSGSDIFSLFKLEEIALESIGNTKRTSTPLLIRSLASPWMKRMKN